MHIRIITTLVFASLLKICITQNEAEYLQNTINELKNKMKISQRKSIQLPMVTPNPSSTPSPIKRTDTEEQKVPSLHLTKAELAAFYENAITKGKTIKLDPGDGSRNKLNAVVHELDGSASHEHPGYEKDHGYYYYYYPLKTFMDEITASSFDNHHETVKLDNHHYHNDHSDHEHDHKYHYHPHEKEVTKPYVHSHTHQHNVHIEPTKNAMDTDKKKGLEPLFMAISGFIGMTVMFVLSILVLPKFDKYKPKRFKESEELTSISRIALHAIEGQDCAERLTCEMGKFANAFNLYNNRFVKFIRRVAPYYISVRIGKIGKYTDTKFKCASIQCKRKYPPPPKFNNKAKIIPSFRNNTKV